MDRSAGLLSLLVLAGCAGAPPVGVKDRVYRNARLGIELPLPSGAEASVQGRRKARDRGLPVLVTITAPPSEPGGPDGYMISVSAQSFGSGAGAGDSSELARTTAAGMKESIPGLKLLPAASEACLGGRELSSVRFSYEQSGRELDGSLFLAVVDGRALSFVVNADGDAGRMRAVRALSAGRLGPGGCRDAWPKARAALAAGDDAVALPLLEAAAAEGFAEAQYNLGRLHDDGRGTAKDTATAVRWYETAAEQGYAPAQAVLGAVYSNGTSAPQDYALAARWLRKAAEQRDPFAALALGMAYDLGRGVPVDGAEALLWVTRSAELHYVPAEAALGMRYLEGRHGAAPDYDKARSWLQKAAGGGDREAMLGMALLHGQGRGVKPDYTESYVWLLRAQAAGDPRAKERLERLDMILRPSEKAEARRRAALR